MPEIAGYSLKKKLLAAVGILAVTAVWGSSFVFMKNSLAALTPLWFLAVRFSLAGFLLLLWQWRNILRLGKQALPVALAVGAPLALGFALQTIGLGQTSASNTAFLTGVYVVVIPLLQWLFTRRLSRANIVIALIAVAGMALFTLDAELQLNKGDIWVLASTISYALHFLALGKYSPQFPSGLLTALQISAAALLLLLAALLLEPLPTAANFTGQVVATLLFTAVCGTVAAFFVQTAAQRVLPPAPASVLFTSESLFGMLAGVLLLNESFIPRQMLGGAIMLLCMVLSVLGESFTDKLSHKLRSIGKRNKAAADEAAGDAGDRSR